MKIFPFITTITTAVVFTISAAIAEERPWESKLSPAGKTALTLHDQLWKELVKKYDVEIQKQANTGLDNLIRLSVLKKEYSILGEVEIEIPEDLQAQAPKFGSVEIHGTGFDGVEKVFYKFANGAKVQANVYDQSGETIKLGTRELRNRGAAGPKWSLVVEGSGQITGVDYHAHGGVSAEFNPSFYMTRGSNKPVKNVTVKINPTTQRFIEGVNKFDPKKYFRLYLQPNWDKSGFEKEFAAQGFLPGRQQVELAHRLEQTYGIDGFERMKEDPDRPGYYDKSYFERNNFGRYSEVPKDLEFSMCFNIWPSFMDVKIDGVKNERGTPKDFEIAADLAADYVKAQKRDSGRTATWWEVKNEVDVQTEWSYHWVKGYDGWKELADFHNIVADKVKAVAPETKVGGPASAWFHPEKKNFSQWDNHKKFMDDTKDHLDFYSHHFYEKTWLDTHEALWKGYDNFLHGKLDCTLDMLQAHMRTTDNKKPLVITEYGSLLEGGTDQDCWVRVKNLNHLLIDFMQRPADFDLTVPFLIPFMHWDPSSGWAMITQNADGSYNRNKNGYFIDFWKGFGGERIEIHEEEHKLVTHAVRDGNKVVAVLSNRTGQMVNVNLELEGLWAKRIASVKAKRVFFADNNLQFEEKAADLNSISIGNEECCMVTIEMPMLDPWKKESRSMPYYAPETALKFGADKDAVFNIKIPADQIKEENQQAVARLGIYRANGFSGNLRVQINGYDHTIDLSHTKGIKTYFDWVEVPIAEDQLRADNVIIVTGEESARAGSAKIILTTTSVKAPQPKPAEERIYKYPR